MTNSRCAIVIALLSVASASAAGPELTRMISQLGDPDPRVREKAEKGIVDWGETAREPLRAARSSTNPAIAEAAKRLLFRLPFDRPSDPIDATTLLRDYGRLPPEKRVDRLQRLAAIDHPAAGDLVLRTADDEPSDDVVWEGLADFFSEKNVPAIQRMDHRTTRLPLVHVLLREQLHRDDPHAVATLSAILDRQSELPDTALDPIGGSSESLWPYRSPEARAVRLRALRFLAEREDPETCSAAADLLMWHARHLSMNELAHDMPQFEKPGMEEWLTPILVHMSPPGDVTVVSRMLDQLAIDRARSDPQHDPRVGRLIQLASTFNWIGAPASARRTLEAALETEHGDLARSLTLQLYEAIRLQRDHRAAAELLMRIINDPAFAHESILGLGHPSDSAECARLWDEVDLHYYRAAAADGDEPGMIHHAQRLLASPAATGEMFETILPTLERCVTRAQIDAMFDRIYEARKANIARQPMTWTKNDLAWFCATNNRRLADAVHLAEEVLAEAPAVPAYLDTLAEAKFRQGDVDEAIRLETMAISLSPDEPILKDQLARFKRARATTRPTP
jgi:tetratricopeptide (TPR) repeat protein